MQIAKPYSIEKTEKCCHRTKSCQSQSGILPYLEQRNPSKPSRAYRPELRENNEKCTQNPPEPGEYLKLGD